MIDMRIVKRCIVFGTGLVLLAIFTFTDLKISTAICTKNLYGRIFEVIGELPFEFLTMLAAVLLFRFRSKKNLAGNIILGILSGLLIALLAFMSGFMTKNYLADNLGIELPGVVSLLIGLLVFVGAVIVAMQVKEEYAKAALRYAAVAVFYFLAVIIVMNALKTVWDA
ncbi:MAG: hypothetical protein SOV61_11070 [Lachnospiraceae bacterium]|nr:hypothetical protein [Lachnospiraceae bacterium]